MEKFLWNDPEIEQLLLNDAEKETLEKFIGADAELPDMLNARERRVWMQEQLLSEFPGVLVSFTLNIPGPVKVLPLVPEAFAFALSEIVSALDTAKIPVLKRSLILDGVVDVHSLEHLEAIHDRHVDVQQHQCDVPGLRLHFFQAFLSVFCFKNAVIAAQDLL